MSQDYVPKSHSKALVLGLQTDTKKIYILYEVLDIDFDQGAAKLSKVKVEDQRKISADSADPRCISSNWSESADILFDLQL